MENVVKGIHCYGFMTPCSNTLVVTDADETVLYRGWDSWQKCVEYVLKHFPGVVEISAV